MLRHIWITEHNSHIALRYDDARGTPVLFCAFSEPEVRYTCPAQSRGDNLSVGIQVCLLYWCPRYRRNLI